MLFLKRKRKREKHHWKPRISCWEFQATSTRPLSYRLFLFKWRFHVETNAIESFELQGHNVYNIPYHALVKKSKERRIVSMNQSFIRFAMEKPKAAGADWLTQHPVLHDSWAFFFVFFSRLIHPQRPSWWTMKKSGTRTLLRRPRSTFLAVNSSASDSQSTGFDRYWKVGQREPPETLTLFPLDHAAVTGNE